MRAINPDFPKKGRKSHNVDQKIFMTQTFGWTLPLCKCYKSTLASLNQVELGRCDKFEEGSKCRFFIFPHTLPSHST